MTIRHTRRAVVTAAGALGLAALAPRAPAAEAAHDLFVTGDVVLGGANIPPDQAPMRACVLSSRFPRNAEMVFRVRVIDPATDESMDDSALEKVEVQLSNGLVFPLHFGAHPPTGPTDSYWSFAWHIPKDQPTGTLQYTFTATAADGRMGDFQPFNVALNLPTIIDEVLADAGA